MWFTGFGGITFFGLPVWFLFLILPTPRFLVLFPQFVASRAPCSQRGSSTVFAGSRFEHVPVPV
jgi:hypothetical protein